MGKHRTRMIGTAVLLAAAMGCQDVRLEKGIITYKGKPVFIVGVWAGYSVTYKLPKFKEGVDEDLPMYTDGCTADVAEHMGFLSAHPAVPIRDTLKRLAPQMIRRPKDDREGAYTAFVQGMGKLPLSIDFAGPSALSKSKNSKRLAADMYQQNPGWCSFVPLCPENPKAWRLYEDYFRTGTQKTLAAGANPFIYEIFNEPAYNCRCRWNREMFRRRMEHRYGTIAAANAVWGTTFKSFDEMEQVPKLRDHKGLWVDWMKFIGDRYCSILLDVKDVIRKVDTRRPIYFMEQPAVSMVYVRTNGIDSYKVAQVMDAVGMEGGVTFGAFKPLTAKDPMEGVIVNSSVLSHQLYLDMARSFGKPILNTEFYCGRFHDGVRFPSRRTDLSTGLWVELIHGVSSDYFYNWGRRWWEWQDLAGAKRSAREARYKAFSLLNPYAYPPESLYGIRDFSEEMDLLGDLALPMPRIQGEIAVLVSNPTSRMMMQKFAYTASGAHNPYETRMRAWYSELIFSHYPLDMLYEEDLAKGKAKAYRAVVVPYTPYIHRSTVAALRDYTAKGGVVIAEHGSLAMDEYGRKIDGTLKVDWIAEGLKGKALPAAIAKSLGGIGVRPAVEMTAEDGNKEPLMVEAHMIDRGDVKLLFLLSWGVRSRLVTLRVPNVERLSRILDLKHHPEKMAPRYHVVDPITNVTYANEAWRTWSPEQLRKGLQVALPAQTRKILLLTKKPWGGEMHRCTAADVREEHKRALAVDEKELAMVAAEFEAERKATEAMTVDFGGPKNTNGSYKTDPATALLCHFDGTFDSPPKPEVTGKPSFAPGKFGTQGVVVREGDQIVYTLPPTFDKDHGTIEAWVKPGWRPVDGKRHTVFTLKGEGSWDQNAIGLYKNLNYEFTFFVRGKDKKGCSASVPVNIFKKDTWVHLAATWDSRSGVKLYVNGKPEKEGKGTWQMDALPRLWIGSNTGGKRAWDGVIDELRVSNVVREPK